VVTLTDQIAELEQKIFIQCLNHNGWARGATCTDLGISPGKFARLIDDCGIRAEYTVRGRSPGGNQRVPWKPVKCPSGP